MNRFRGILLKVCGFILVGLGSLGIVIPGLPTTPFMIVAAFCFMKSSDRMYKWVTTNKLFGSKVKKFMDNRSIPLRGKIYCISAMWIMIIVSMIFIITELWLYLLFVILGVAGTISILMVKTFKE